MKISIMALFGILLLSGCDSPGPGTATGNSEDSTTISNSSSSSQTRSPDTSNEGYKNHPGQDSDYTNHTDTPGYPQQKK